MGWPASILIGILTGLATMLAAGYVANLAAGWHRMSSFEGASGYFVVLVALLGLAVGLGIGIGVARWVGADGFLKALGLGLLASLGLVGIIGGISRQLADIPPRLRGEELTLAVELRWPPGEKPPDANSADWFLQLGSSVGRIRRATRSGPLWREDARFDDGRWIVPGAVDVFTSRGDRIIDVVPKGIIPNGFVIPLPARPKAAQLEWSEWLPRRPDGQPSPSGGVSYRFRVVPASKPLRTETFGPFEITTYSKGLGEVTFGNQPPMWTAAATFAIDHRGDPVIIEQADRMIAVLALAGPHPALLAQVGSDSGEGVCWLLVSEAGRLRVERAGPCNTTIQRIPLTDDAAVFAEAHELFFPEGRFDRRSMTRARYYLLDESVLDTGSLTVRPLPELSRDHLVERIPPVGVSPDGLSFVRLAWDESSGDDLALVVSRIDTGEQYQVPIDKARMRYFSMDQIDPAWVLHHFEWKAERLIERTGYQPLPWHGELSMDRSGYREYRLGPAADGLRAALIDFLVTSFQGERLPAQADAYSHEVRVGDVVVNVSFDVRDGQVSAWVDRGADSKIVAAIAERFDAELATYRLDHLFGR